MNELNFTVLRSSDYPSGRLYEWNYETRTMSLHIHNRFVDINYIFVACFVAGFIFAWMGTVFNKWFSRWISK